MGSDRRQFIKNALFWLLSLLGLGALLTGTRVLEPSGGQDKALAWFPLADEDAVPRSGVTKAELTYAVAGKERRTRVFIVSSPQRILVLSAVCSHLGCLVNYRRETREFVCPCHGGKYDLSGLNVSGPPPMPLTAYPVEVRSGVVMVGVKV